MAVGRSDYGHARLGQPAVDDIERLIGAERMVEHGRTGAEPHEGEQDLPGKRDRAGARQRLSYPGMGGGVMRGGLIRRVEQQVDVGQLHLRSASLRTISASSESAARCSARSRSIPGLTPIRCDGIR